jgi:hypothetical protein
VHRRINPVLEFTVLAIHRDRYCPQLIFFSIFNKISAVKILRALQFWQCCDNDGIGDYDGDYEFFEENLFEMESAICLGLHCEFSLGNLLFNQWRELCYRVGPLYFAGEFFFC